VLGVLPGIVGTIQATEAIKWLLGTGETLAGRLLLIDALRMEFRSLSVSPDPKCPVCGENPTVTELIDYEQFCGPRTSAADPSDTEQQVDDQEIDVAELKRRVDEGESFQLIDVREQYEWDICNLADAGARLVPLQALAQTLEELDRNQPVVIHCRSGPRGTHAVAYLRTMGFEDVVNVAGGILAWAEAYDPDMQVY
jgi:adenylyltransferase/sulfurtransferase